MELNDHRVQHRLHHTSPSGLLVDVESYGQICKVVKTVPVCASFRHCGGIVLYFV